MVLLDPRGHPYVREHLAADAMVATNPIDWTGVDARMRAAFEGQVSAVCCSLGECQDLVAFFGGERNANFQPYLPILLVIPGTVTGTVVCGEGVTTITELRDLCVETWGKLEERLRKNGGRIFDFEELRDRIGYPSRANGDADAMIREAMQERVRRHKANPVTDPAPDPMRWTYPRVSFPVSEREDVQWPM